MFIKPKKKSLSHPVPVNRKGDFEGKSGWIGKRERGVKVFYPDSDFELVPEYKKENSNMHVRGGYWYCIGDKVKLTRKDTGYPFEEGIKEGDIGEVVQVDLEDVRQTEYLIVFPERGYSKAWVTESCLAPVRSDNIDERLNKLEKTVAEHERIIRTAKIYKVLSRIINDNGDIA